jgi:hypothetical protein
MDSQLSLIVPPGVRHFDHPTSVAPDGRRLNELHREVLSAFEAHGRLTDEELERLPQFGCYGPSTIRKRRSELYLMGQLVRVGERNNSRGRRMVVWGMA